MASMFLYVVVVVVMMVGFEVKAEESGVDRRIDVQQISSGRHNNLVLLEDGTVLGWGDNSEGNKLIRSNEGDRIEVQL